MGGAVVGGQWLVFAAGDGIDGRNGDSDRNFKNRL